ncbi:MAG TPA: hypothetical protein VHZ24_08180 [Pirellulales bacterium]|jgi:uncharacterized repeat protein (TIGR01451 family)|nr:hypothetical protein [Pirellulales bacterium]
MAGSNQRQSIARALLVAASILLGSGCANFNVNSCIDPTGDRIFKHTGTSSCPVGCPFGGPSCGKQSCHQGHKCPLHHPPKPINCHPEPGTIGVHQPVGLCITPQTIVAPVGAEVVLKAAICDQHGLTTANEKVEWMIAPGGVGEFVALGENSWYDMFLGAPLAKKVSSTYAVNATSSTYLCLNRGTPSHDDDVPVIKGQAWVTVSSPLEGLSRVTAYAPNVYGWDQRQRTATVYWIDACWNFPPAAINPAGTRQTLTTSVARQTSGSPQPGYRVRYEILDGPPANLLPGGTQTVGYNSAESGTQTAGFAPEGSQIIEVPTDSLGQAHVDIVQTTAAPGTNHVSVQIIRPGELSADGSRLAVATGSTQATWGSPSLFVRKTGPVQASVGSTMVYNVEVRNSGAGTLRGVTVTEQLPQGTTLVGSNPAARPGSGALMWNFGDLSPGESRRIELSLRADRFGTINNCVTARAADGTTAQDCVTTTITAPSIDVAVNVNPAQATVGSRVTFTARVTNRGGDPARSLVIVERFDGGLKHDVAPNPIEADLGDLQPGQSRDITSTFTITAPGQLCNRVEVQGQAGLRATGQACVNAVPAATAPAIAPPPITAPPVTSTGQKPTLVVRKNGPATKNVGDEANFEITVTNNGPVVANMLKISDNYDLSLDPIGATDGHSFAGDDLVWLVDTLPVGKTIRFQVNCRCVARNDKACNRVTVTSQEGARGDSEACLAIQGSAAGLQVNLGDLTDPVAVGKQTTFQLLVTNPATVADSQIAASITLPQGMTPVPSGTVGPSAYSINGNTVTYAPVASLVPGATLTYRVQAQAVQPGSARATASVTSTNMTSAATADETTTVFAQ